MQSKLIDVSTTNEDINTNCNTCLVKKACNNRRICEPKYKKGIVAGVGINEADYPVENCPYYRVWVDMISRCYRNDGQKSYKDVTVDPEWHYFSIFKSWMEKQDWKGKQLDKDIKHPGSRHYSAETCQFVSQKENLSARKYNAKQFPLEKTFFMELTAPETKIKRTPIDGYSGLYLEQNKSGYTFQFSYKSPATGKYRFMKLARYKYGDNINKKMLDNIIMQLVINQGQIIKGNDPLEDKKAKTTTQVPTTGGKSVNTVFDIFTSSHHFKQLAKSTQEHYFSVYENHIADSWGKKSVAKIRRPDVVAFLNGFDKDAVYNNVKTILQSIQSQTMDLGIIDVPFMFEIKRRQTRTRTETLTKEEVISLMESTSGWDSLRNICKMQLLTGCRNGEVAGMRCDEIDIKAKIT